MAENFPTNGNNEHLTKAEQALLRAERLKKHLMRLERSTIEEVDEKARAIKGMAKMTFGMPILNPIVATDDDDEDEEENLS